MLEITNNMETNKEETVKDKQDEKDKALEDNTLVEVSFVFYNLFIIKINRQ